MHTIFRKSSFRPSALITWRPIVLAIGLGLFAGGASAQWAVVDAGNIATNEQGFASQLAKTIEQYTTQLKEYATQLQQYQQMLSSIQGLSSGMSLAPNTLQHADAGPLIQAKCASSSGSGIVGNVMSSLTSLLSQPLSDSQQQLCVQITTTQVDKYNKTVDMLGKLHSYSDMFSQVEKVAQSISTVADAGRASNQAQDYNNALTTEMANWEAQMRADDSIIKTLEDQQSILSHIALNGSNNSVLGDALPNSIFQSAIGGVE